MITIDGSYGEGGGQVLRTSLSLSALQGEAVRIENIRAKRPKPGLQAQHLTGVLATAQICNAELEGAELGSQTLTFAPQSPPQAGDYTFDVAKARKGGSAGSTSLVFQTLLLPLAFADGDSHLTIRGGTHVAWSPPFHYLKHVYLPTLARMGIEATVEINQWGWYPIGGGEIKARVKGQGIRDGGASPIPYPLSPITLVERGELKRLWGISALSNLPAHIGQRQKRQVERLLRERGFTPEIEMVDAPSPGQGTVVFLVAEFENVVAGFTSYGARGKRAEKVAEEACREFIQYYDSGQALDKHLADQLILPMSLAAGQSGFTTCEVTQHLLTNVGVVERLMGVKAEVQGKEVFVKGFCPIYG
ncbi:MAG: RNA 3'-phosphate cyclase [Anaerolineales bacterium]|nr:MAG: RNA 3'-phosphate cyclase [Anaerolineales bacterium]